MSDTTQDRLARIAQRVEKATPGPWQATYNSSSIYGGEAGAEFVGETFEAQDGDEPPHPDAEFIAHARTDIPAMHAALAAALAVHKNGGTWCTHCKVHRYPCPTVRAINDALGGE